jgi:Dolichyl-phosphate-mannose-protein mannosyltransferase
MLPLLLTILTTVVLGLPVALSLRPASRPGETLGLSYLLGSGVVFVSMLALSILNIRWSSTAVLIVALAVSGAFLAAFLRRGQVTARDDVTPRPHDTGVPRVIGRLADLITLVMLAGHVFYATLAPLWEWDFWAIWGLKARVFFEHGGIDRQWLENPFNTFAHNDYPLLLPFNYDAAALAAGGWTDRWLGLLFAAFAAALTLIARDVLLRHTAPVIASLGTLIIVSIATTRSVGMAEGPMIAFSGAALIYLFEAIASEDPADYRIGAVLLGLGASTKNEGLALIVAAACGLLVCDPSRWRRVKHLWPAAAIALPWLLLRAWHSLPTDLATGSVSSRFAARVAQLPEMTGWLVQYLPHPLFWIVLLAAWIVCALWRRAPSGAGDARAIRFLFVAVAVQLLFYLLSYLVTPNDVHWHIDTSWARLTDHLSVPLVFATVVMVGRIWEAPNIAVQTEVGGD